MRRLDPRVSILPLLLGCATAPGGGPDVGAGNAPGDPLRAALTRAVAEPGSWTDLRLLVECRDDRRPGALEIYGNGVGIWQGNRQFRLDPAGVSGLLRILDEGGFLDLRDKYGGKGITEPGRREEDADKAIFLVCILDLRLDGLQKQVVQLAKGYQSQELLALADRLFDYSRPHGEAGVAARDLADGLRKASAGELVPETLSLDLIRRPSPSAPPGTKGYRLRLDGLSVLSRVFTTGEGYAPALGIELDGDQFASLAEVLHEAAPGSLPGNLWAPDYTELAISVLDQKVSIQARRFRDLEPATHGEQQRRFDRLYEALEQLHGQVVTNGSPIGSD